MQFSQNALIQNRAIYTFRCFDLEQIGKNTNFGRRVCPMDRVRATDFHKKFMPFCYEKKHSYAFLNRVLRK